MAQRGAVLLVGVVALELIACGGGGGVTNGGRGGTTGGGAGAPTAGAGGRASAGGVPPAAWGAAPRGLEVRGSAARRGRAARQEAVERAPAVRAAARRVPVVVVARAAALVLMAARAAVPVPVAETGAWAVRWASRARAAVVARRARPDSAGAGGTAAACTAGPAMDFTSVVLPCPSSRTCVADPLGRIWTPPIRIDDGTACLTGDVQATIAADGSALVAWADTSPGRVRARRLSAGGVWSAVEDAHGGWGSTLRLARAPTGDAMLVSTDGRHVRASPSVSGAPWTTPADISGQLANDDAAELAMDKTGEAMAVWVQDTSNSGKTTWSKASGAWTTPVLGAPSGYQVAVAATPNGGFGIAATTGSAVTYYGSVPTGTFQGYAFGLVSGVTTTISQSAVALFIAAGGEPCAASISPAAYPNPGTFQADCHHSSDGYFSPETSGDNYAMLGTRPHIAASADGKTVLTAWSRSLINPPRGYATVVQNERVIGPVGFEGPEEKDTMEAVAMDDAGDGVVVWGSAGVYENTVVTAFRFFGAAGSWEQSDEPLFTSTILTELTSLAVVTTPTGETLVVYSIHPPNATDQVYAQLLK